MRDPELILVPALFITIGFIISVVVNGWQRRLRLKLTTEFHSKLLDRIGSVKDFNDFLQTDGGATFMDSLTVERSASRPEGQHPARRADGHRSSCSGSASWPGPVLRGEIRRRHGGVDGDRRDRGVVGPRVPLSAGASYRLARLLGVLDPPGRQGGAGGSGRDDRTPR